MEALYLMQICNYTQCFPERYCEDPPKKSGDFLCRSGKLCYLCGANLYDGLTIPHESRLRLGNIRAFFMPIYAIAAAISSDIFSSAE